MSKNDTKNNISKCFIWIFNQYKPATADAQGLEAATGVPMVIFSPSAPSTSMTSTPPSSGASGASVTKSFYMSHAVSCNFK